MAPRLGLAEARRGRQAGLHQADSRRADHRGFDLYFGTDVPNYPPYCFIENDRTVGIPSADAPVGRDSFNIAGPMVPGWKLVEVLPGLEKRAVEYIEKAAKGDKPFFLYLPLTSPHYPVVPAAEFKGKSKAGDYGDFVVQTDHVVGAGARRAEEERRRGEDACASLRATTARRSPAR